MPSGGELVHLLVVPVAGVGDDDLGCLVDACRVELSDGRLDHRLEMAEVGTVDTDLRGEHDLALVGRGLGVVGLEVGIAAPPSSGESRGRSC